MENVAAYEVNSNETTLTGVTDNGEEISISGSLVLKDLEHTFTGIMTTGPFDLRGQKCTAKIIDTFAELTIIPTVKHTTYPHLFRKGMGNEMPR